MGGTGAGAGLVREEPPLAVVTPLSVAQQTGRTGGEEPAIPSPGHVAGAFSLDGMAHKADWMQQAQRASAGGPVIRLSSMSVAR